jgi:hypothetical protein
MPLWLNLWVTMGRSHSLSEPEFSHPWNERETEDLISEKPVWSTC